jgi:hypothetical protein
MNKVEIKNAPTDKISIGQYYQQDAEGRVYFLTTDSAGRAILSDLSCGATWDGAHPVKDTRNISASEFERICGGAAFTRITSPITITPEA